MRRLLVLSLVALATIAPVSAQTRIKLQAPIELYSYLDFQTASGITLNAAGEYTGFVGRLYISDGATSKTCSSSGCAISYPFESLGTWADAGTTVRVGIQTVDGTGFPDGTFDVYYEAVGNVDPSPGGGRVLIETGSASYSSGDIVAFMVTMTARGGADSITPDRAQWQANALSMGLPYGVNNTGSPAKANIATLFTIEFDDGTVGWIDGFPWLGIDQSGISSAALDTTTNPDEYAAVIRLPFAYSLSGVGLVLGSIAATDDFELIVYSDPEGSPSAVHTHVVADPVAEFGTATGLVRLSFANNVDVAASTTIGIAVRPTTANGISVFYESAVSSAIASAFRLASPFEVLKFSGRQNQTGAFSEVATDRVPVVVLFIAELIQ